MPHWLRIPWKVAHQIGGAASSITMDGHAAGHPADVVQHLLVTDEIHIGLIVQQQPPQWNSFTSPNAAGECHALLSAALFSWAVGALIRIVAILMAVVTVVVIVFMTVMAIRW